jgi:hypothetical protein
MFKGYSQENLNTYKYVIVPKKFDAFKKENQYKTSTLVKFLFTKNGFNAVYDDALPEELENNRCLGVLVSVTDESSMFTTKTALELKDCSSKKVVTTIMGSSKEKEYESAYREALTEAFTTIKALGYQYFAPEKGEVAITENVAPMIEKKQPKNKPDQTVVKQEATTENQLYKTAEPVASKIEKVEPEIKVTSVGEQKDGNILYAQKISDGYQLVDSTPKIKLKLYRTSIPDIFTVKHEKDNGVVFKKDGKWFLEYYIGSQLMTEELNIKF